MNRKAFKLEYIVIAILLILVLTKLSLLSYIDSSLQSLLVISFFIFSIISIVGIFLQKHWGYFAVYIFIFISSVFLGIAPIPFVTKLFPVTAATIVVILTSAVLLSFTVFLQLRVFKNDTQKTT